MGDLTELAKAILAVEQMNHSTSFALKSIAAALTPINGEHSEIKFRIKVAKSEGECFLILNTIKGSLLTSLWSTFARVDDEYSLLFVRSAQSIDCSTRTLWSVEGVNALNSKINKGEIDWFCHRDLQRVLKVTQIGVLAFAKLLGRLLLSYSLFKKEGKYLTAMPVSFMLNYLVVVSSCPLEIRITDVPKFLASDFERHQITNKDILPTLMYGDGRGVWVLNFFPFKLPDGGTALCYRGNLGAGGASSLTSTATTTSAVTAAATVAAGGQDPLRSYHETAVRVVELIENNLDNSKCTDSTSGSIRDGVNGLVAVVELVHHHNWQAMRRFVVLDVYLLCRVIRLQSSGRATECEGIQLSLVGEQKWNQRRLDVLSKVMSNVQSTKQLSDAYQCCIDFANSAQWGLPIRDKSYYDSIEAEVTLRSDHTNTTTSSSSSCGGGGVTNTTVTSSDQDTTGTSASKSNQENRRSIGYALPSFDSVFN